MKLHVRWLLLMVAVACGAVGCSSSKVIERYPKFHEQKKQLGRGTLVVDVCIVDDITGDIDLVDLPENLDIGRALTDSLVEQLKRKGYGFRLVEPPSVGRFIRPGSTYKIVSTVGERDSNSDSLRLDTSPFFVDPTLAADTVVLRAIALHDSIYAGSLSVEANQAITRRSDTTIDRRSIDPLLLVSVWGNRVSFGKQFGQVALSSLLTLGYASVRQKSQMWVRLMVLDMETGAEIWYDGRFMDDGIPGMDSVIGIATSQVEEIPDKNAAVPTQR